MLVFIDESGDPGFKVAKGSSPLFVVAMVIFQTNEAANTVSAAIDVLRGELGVKPEFKFAKCQESVRDQFFETVRTHDFGIRAIVVKKDLIYSQHLRTDKNDFYRFFVKTMMKFDSGILEDARVIIDGSGDRLFQQDLKRYLRNELPKGAIRDVRLKESHTDSLLQLADMCVGAVARSYRTDRKNHYRWRDMIDARIVDIWEFE